MNIKTEGGTDRKQRYRKTDGQKGIDCKMDRQMNKRQTERWTDGQTHQKMDRKTEHRQAD